MLRRMRDDELQQHRDAAAVIRSCRNEFIKAPTQRHGCGS